MIAGRLATLALLAAAAQAQVPRAQSESAADYRSARDYVIHAAEKMPEADYGYGPAPEVRTFGQQIAHIADLNSGSIVFEGMQ